MIPARAAAVDDLRRAHRARDFRRPGYGHFTAPGLLGSSLVLAVLLSEPRISGANLASVDEWSGVARLGAKECVGDGDRTERLRTASQVVKYGR